MRNSIARYFQSQGLDSVYVNPKEAGLLVSDEIGNAQSSSRIV